MAARTGHGRVSSMSMGSNWLSQLAPPHAPPPPGWWPPGPGWWLLAAAAVALLVACAWLRMRPQALRRRWALRELRRIRIAMDVAGIGSEAADAVSLADSARAIESLLRRYALAVFGRAEVARLSGRAWLGFLQQHGAAALSEEAGQSLLRAAFGGAVHDHRQAWLTGAEAFLRQAHIEGSRA